MPSESNGDVPADMASMSQEEFESWLDALGFVAGSQPCQLVEAMRDSMLHALLMMQTAVQDAQTAVA